MSLQGKGSRAVWTIVAGFILLFVLSTMSEAAMRFKVSHQFAEGDVRDQLARVFADKVTQKLGKDIEFRVYPASSLFKPKEQWDAMKQGTLDLSVF